MRILLVLAYLQVLNLSAQANEFWLPQNTPSSELLQRICFVDSLTGWAVGDGGVIIATTNGGVTWLSQNSGINYTIDDVFFLNSRLGWAVANDFFFAGSTILRTSNGGTTWTFSHYPDTTLYLTRIYFLDSLNGWLGGLTNQIMLQTMNGGISWTAREIDSSECAWYPVRGITFYSPQYGFACGGYFDVAGHVLRTTDYGMSWTATCVSAEPIFDMVIFDSLNLLGVGGDFEFGASVAWTSDGGANWSYEWLEYFGTGYAVAFRTPSEGWMPLGFAGTWALTTDSGNTWQELGPPDSISVYDVTFTDQYHGYACGSNGAVLKYNTELIGLANDNGFLPASPTLRQNYPNPFNPSTTIEFSLPKTSRVKVVIYDLLGKEVRTLLNEIRREGVHRIRFNSDGLPSGVYLYRLTAGSYSETKKLVVVR